MATTDGGASGPVASSPRPTQRAMVLAVGRAATTSATLVLVYFVIPIGRRETSLSLVLFGAGLAGFTLLLSWQIRSVMQSKAPWLRAIEVLTTSVPLFLLFFATTYYVLSLHHGDAFSGSLTRLDALYFTVTVFATVGFGDISAHTQTARAIVTVQMVSDLIVIGVGIRVLLGAVRIGLERQGRPAATPGADSAAVDTQHSSSTNGPSVGVSSGADDAN